MRRAKSDRFKIKTFSGKTIDAHIVRDLRTGTVAVLTTSAGEELTQEDARSYMIWLYESWEKRERKKRRIRIRRKAKK